VHFGLIEVKMKMTGDKLNRLGKTYDLKTIIQNYGGNCSNYHSRSAISLTIPGSFVVELPVSRFYPLTPSIA
jgi:hypothetical protein